MLAILSALMILTAASFAVIVMVTSISGSWAAISAALGYRQVSVGSSNVRHVVRRSRASLDISRLPFVVKVAAFS